MLEILKIQIMHFIQRESSITSFFNDQLQEKRGFKYFLSIKITVRKWKNESGTFIFNSIYRKSDTITVINTRFNLDKAYELLKHRVEFYNNEGSGSIVDSIENIWININTYEPLSGSRFIELLKKLKGSNRGLINIKNHIDNKCLMWSHIRHLFNPLNKNLNRITSDDRKIAKKLDFSGINFPLSINDYELVEKRFGIN